MMAYPDQARWTNARRGARTGPAKPGLPKMAALAAPNTNIDLRFMGRMSSLGIRFPGAQFPQAPSAAREMAAVRREKGVKK
jgi:hypothetical protein